MARPSLSRFVSVANPREVGLITVAHGVNEFYSVALPPILPLLVTDLNITYAQAGGLVTVFYVMYSVFQLPAGVLSDRIGKKRLLALGMIGLAAGMLLAGVARTYPTLVVAQAIAGIGGSTYHPTGMSLIADLETAGTEGRAMGVHGFGGVAGTALAPALIGGLAALYDWRLALSTSAVVGVAYAGGFTLLFAEESADEDPVPDGDGGGPGWFDDPRGALVDRLRVPLTPWLGVLFAANFFVALGSNAARSFTTSYVFVRTAGESTAFANGVFFLMLVGAGLSSIWAGHLADVVDRRALGVGTSLLTAALLIVTPLVPTTAVLLVWFFALGAAMYAVMPAINALTSEYSDRRFSGSLFGIMLTAGSLGGALGPLLLGIVANWIGLTGAYPLIAVVSVLGAIAFLPLYRI